MRKLVELLYKRRHELTVQLHAADTETISDDRAGYQLLGEERGLRLARNAELKNIDALLDAYWEGARGVA